MATEGLSCHVDMCLTSLELTTEYHIKGQLPQVNTPTYITDYVRDCLNDIMLIATGLMKFNLFFLIFGTSNI